jgi:hypothetical protein
MKLKNRIQILESYLTVVRTMPEGAYPCCHGHIGCAAHANGACSDEVEIELNELQCEFVGN